MRSSSLPHRGRCMTPKFEFRAKRNPCLRNKTLRDKFKNPRSSYWFLLTNSLSASPCYTFSLSSCKTLTLTLTTTFCNKHHLISAHRSVRPSVERLHSVATSPTHHAGSLPQCRIIFRTPPHPATCIAPGSTRACELGKKRKERFPQTGAGRGMCNYSSRVVMNCAADKEHCQDVRPSPHKIRAALRKARPKWCKERATRSSKCGSVGKATNKSPTPWRAGPPTSLSQHTLSQ